jgi:NTP pyrophosphatase (non-canonical NTP hydrolase)
VNNTDYEDFVRAQAQIRLDDHDYNALGLCGEAGEVAEWHKKVYHRPSPSRLTKTDLLLELGDVLHYITRIALAHGWTLKDVWMANKAKLEARRIAQPKI